MTRYDVVIVGTGAGGGTLAWRLASTGKKVLLLERGDWLPRERENWDPEAVGPEMRYRARVEYEDSTGTRFAPYTHHWVGGNTKMYGAALLRLRQSDFDARCHESGATPAWPISYRDLEPYYARAEALYSVHGARGLDPTEPPSSTPYPHRALAHEPRIARLAEELAGQGLRPFSLPIGVRLPESGAPVRLSLFDGFPDPTETKADAQVCAVEPALRTGHVELWTHAFAERLATSASGREISGVVVRRGGSDERVTVCGDIVVVACGAIESAALFLRSASGAHPRGLSNRSGLVGRCLMKHQNGALIWVSRETENDARFQKTLGLTDWYHRGPDGESALGAVQLMGRSQVAELVGLSRGLIEDQSAREIAARSVDFWLTAEDFPDPGNRVELTQDGTIRVVYARNNEGAYLGLRRALERVLSRIEPSSRFLAYELGIAGLSHQNGTLRFGRDPSMSVLDPDCRAHEVDNLYVVDASCFPSCGAVNPSLTIMANALRVGDHLAGRLS